MLAAIEALASDTLAMQLDVSRIAAPTGAERARGEWVGRRFADCGLSARMDEVGNVIARTPGEGRAVAVAAHLDTVFAADTPLTFARSGARITGPGIADNGRGLAVMLAIARVAASTAPAGARPLELVATVGEEGQGNLRGARHYIGSNPAPSAFIALDGAGDDGIVNVALGCRRLRIEYRGPGGHSWNAFGIANPVHAAARAASAIARLRAPGSPPWSVTVSRIGGGESVNAIPSQAWLEIDARSTSDESLATLERAIRDAATTAAREETNRRRSGRELSLAVTEIGSRPAGHTASASPLVQNAVSATRAERRNPALTTASTDASAAMAAGIPAIAIGGGGRSGDAHTVREWYDDTDGMIGVRRALAIVSAARARSD